MSEDADPKPRPKPRKGWSEFSWTEGVGLLLLAAAVIIISLFRQSQETHAEQREEAAKYKLKAEYESGRPDCHTLPFFEAIICAAQTNPTTREDREREYDLQAQQKMADWAVIMGLSSMAGFLVSGVALWALMRTLEATRQANEHFATTAQREQRAYIVVTAVSVTGFEAEQTPAFELHYVNRGNTPARDFMWWCETFTVDGPEHKFKVRPANKIRLQKARQVLGPGQETILPISGEAELTKAMVTSILSGQKSYIIAAVFRYRDVFGQRHWTTVKAVIQPNELRGPIGALAWADRGNFAT